MSERVYLGSSGRLAHKELPPAPSQEALAIFMDTVDDLAPEVGKSFWNTFGAGFPEGEAAFHSLMEWLAMHGLGDWGQDLDAYTSEEVNRPLWQVIRAFLEAPYYCEWQEAGAPTMEGWVECRKEGLLGPIFAVSRYGRDTVPVDSPGRHFPSEEVYSVAADAPVYNPFQETRDEFVGRAKDYASRVEEASLKNGAERARRINNPRRDFELLVRRVILRQTAEEIAEELNLENESGDYDSFDKVQKAIQRSSKLIGLRIPAGRPRKKVGH